MAETVASVASIAGFGIQDFDGYNSGSFFKNPGFRTHRCIAVANFFRFLVFRQTSSSGYVQTNYLDFDRTNYLDFEQTNYLG